MSPLRGSGDTKGRTITNYLVAAGDAAGFTDTGELAAAGVDVDCGVVPVAAGLAAGCDEFEPAGRRPRLFGLFSI